MAVNSVNELIAQISTNGNSGFAKFNRWQIQLPFIPGIVNNYEADKLNIYCSSITLPGRQVTSFDYYTSLRAKYMAYGYGAAGMTVNFYVTSDWYAWRYINAWHNKVIPNMSFDRGFKVGFYDDYAKDITVTNLGLNGEKKMSMRVIGAFPTTMNAVEFNNEPSNSVYTCSAEFQFLHWVDETVLESLNNRLASPF